MHPLLTVHPETPQRHHLRKAVEVLSEGGVIVYPTDSGYALACDVGRLVAQKRIRQLRQLPDDHHMTLVCRDLSELATYAVVSDVSYRLMRRYTPGAYTFLLKATKEVPRRLQHAKRRTIGLRVPNHRIAQALLEAWGQPLLSTSLILPHYPGILIEPAVIYDLVGSQVDLVLDGGFCGQTPTSVIDLTTDTPQVIRHGNGDVSAFL
jgi:tRNA threonylcarbamoyl adenosine modification protein (Sua5/YciO/YrdC/YwlC family)